MLELKDIRKNYPAGGGEVQALRGIDLKFRKSEFVSILGPSGCGKTTMLNIIGGLDQYTSGDLIIAGRSTKDFKDRDWDAYRNHSIGFVFQTYNLIPHQSVLQNVELALSLSGVGKAERRKRAVAALERVGLGDQLNKKPGEMSGGQMQRVAIARAIVNDPEIILADEPTGALDTETSVQVMEILKEISAERLVIMVTHNPELAERYSTRIITMLDGRVTGDSLPLTEPDAPAAKSRAGRKHPKMSFATSFGLSLKNLFTKKGRTVLTSFAGSIGIIGIALIYAVSQGMTMYIDTVQEDTLSSYPLTLEAQHMDVSTLLETFSDKAKAAEKHENDAIYQKTMIYDLMNSFSSMEEQENDLGAFKAYIDENLAAGDTALAGALSGVQYSYTVAPTVYTKGADGEIILSDTEELLRDLMMEYIHIDTSAMTGGFSMFGSSSMMRSSSMWEEMLSGVDGELISPVIKKQYDLIYGEWPQNYNEVVLVLDKNNEINDLTLYALGLKSRDDIEEVMQAAVDKEEFEYKKESWNYADVCGRDYRVVLAGDCFVADEVTGLYTDLRDTQAGLKYLYDNGFTIKVTGILRPNPDAVSTMLNGAICYTKDLTRAIIDRSEASAAVKAQKETPETDIFTGLPFKDTEGRISDEKKAEKFRSYIAGLSDAEKAAAYVAVKSLPPKDDVNAYVEQTLSALSREQKEEMMLKVLTEQMSLSGEQVENYVHNMSDEDIDAAFTDSLTAQYKAQYAAAVAGKLAAVPPAMLCTMLDEEMKEYTGEQCAEYYEEILVFSEATYEENLDLLGSVDPDEPSGINLFASTFADKDVIKDCITEYNETVDDLKEIRYTDYVGLIMSSVTTVINAITYILIAFVAVSLVVSSIMIGVITLISVQERTKEIGILRAIGASKANVSQMFNAETMIIGLASGLLGVGVTYLLCIPLNLILRSLTGIESLRAYLPPAVGLILVIISMLLTLLAGIIPSRSAAKKDPVVALRTE